MELVTSGRVHVGRGLLEKAPPATEVGAVLMDLDLAARVEMAGDAPPLSMGPALWGAWMVYQGAQFLAHRELEGGLVKSRLGAAAPAAGSPWVTYSVDLTMRYLPDLVALARGLAPSDPLVEGLLGLARAWPLSSVGIAGVGEVHVGSFFGHPALRALYVDRILERKDVARLADPEVREAVREALGEHRELAPFAAAALGDRE